MSVEQVVERLALTANRDTTQTEEGSLESGGSEEEDEEGEKRRNE